MNFLKNKDFKNSFINCLKVFFIMLSFFLMDYGLKTIFKDNLNFKDYFYTSNLFTLCWILIFISILSFFSGKAGKIAYGILYFCWAAYIIIQRGYYLIFDNFLYLGDFSYSGEGAHYAGFVKEIIDLSFIIFILSTIIIGIIGIFIFPSFKLKKRLVYLKIVPAVAGVFGLFAIPSICYGKGNDFKDWNAWQSPAYEYNKFTSSVSDMELTGAYQYVARDIQLKIKNKIRKDDESKIAEIENYFNGREDKKPNEMTGIFEGKNVIIVMLESLDDWIINEENTPTIWNMMHEGINFTNMHTPLYTVGCTFNTEFSFNTGNFPYSNGVTAQVLSDNSFGEALANLFSEKGYTANSFHKGSPEFYKRGIMHEAFGYKKYNSYLDFSDDEKSAEFDTFLPQSDELYNIMTENKPFMDFIITYSAHLPYDKSNHLSEYALKKYPQYDKSNRPYDLNAICAQARITDDMFSQLIDRLDKDNILDDTVIIGFADHYSYGITDEDVLNELTKAEGSDIKEKTPAFIYCRGYDNVENSKVIQTIDLLPTISNLFNLDCPKVLGRDAFDEDYSGYAIFSNNRWLTNEAYFADGEIKYNSSMTQEEIDEMNGFVQQFYKINDFILDTDYYKKNK